MLPPGIDLSPYDPVPPVERERVRIVHAPSNLEKKGTRPHHHIHPVRRAGLGKFPLSEIQALLGCQELVSVDGNEREQASGQDEGSPLLLLAGLDRRLELGDGVIPLAGDEPKRSQPRVVEGHVDGQSQLLRTADALM